MLAGIQTERAKLAMAAMAWDQALADAAAIVAQRNLSPLFLDDAAAGAM